MLSIERHSKFFTTQDKYMPKNFSMLQISKKEIYLLNSLVSKVNSLTKFECKEIEFLNIYTSNVKINIFCNLTDNIRILVSDLIINSKTKEIYLIIDRILNENTGEILSERKITIELFNDDINTNFLDNFTLSNFETFNVFKDLKMLTSPIGIWINCFVI